MEASLIVNWIIYQVDEQSGGQRYGLTSIEFNDPHWNGFLVEAMPD